VAAPSASGRSTIGATGDCFMPKTSHRTLLGRCAVSWMTAWARVLQALPHLGPVMAREADARRCSHPPTTAACRDFRAASMRPVQDCIPRPQAEVHSPQLLVNLFRATSSPGRGRQLRSAFDTAAWPSTGLRASRSFGGSSRGCVQSPCRFLRVRRGPGFDAGAA
jgi:hypothetical protein